MPSTSSNIPDPLQLHVQWEHTPFDKIGLLPLGQNKEESYSYYGNYINGSTNQQLSCASPSRSGDSFWCWGCVVVLHFPKGSWRSPPVQLELLKSRQSLHSYLCPPSLAGWRLWIIWLSNISKPMLCMYVWHSLNNLSNPYIRIVSIHVQDSPRIASSTFPDGCMAARWSGRSPLLSTSLKAEGNCLSSWMTAVSPYDQGT